MSNFPYAGPIEERIPGAPMHCKTTLPNHDCPQKRAGCLGCTFNWSHRCRLCRGRVARLD